MEAKPFLPALFTTLEWAADEIVQFKASAGTAKLRSLKSTLALEQLTCTTPEMVAKEIDVWGCWPAIWCAPSLTWQRRRRA